MNDEEREDYEAAIARHRVNELHLAEEVRKAQRELAQARDTITHMERSLFWRARRIWVWVRGRS